MKQTIQTIACAGILLATSLWAAPIPRGVPTPEQLAWHEMEIEMFLALDPCTWQNREYITARP
jgi:hypothetical protein